MGKMALIIVLGLSLTIGIVSSSLNKAEKGAMENVSSFSRYTTSRNIAHTGVNMMLRRFDKNDTSFTGPVGRGETKWMYSSLMAGVCSVSVRRPNIAAFDTIMITSRSRFLDTTYFMQLRLHREPKPFPTVNAAVGLATAPITFNMTGASKIDGRNYDMNGTLNPDRATDTIGVSVPNAAESTLVAPFASKITGDPSKIKIEPPPDPSGFISQYIDAADYVFPNGSTNNLNYGSASTPVVGYVDGSASFQGNGTFYGILLVKGSVAFHGTFDFYGLILAIGDSSSVNVDVSAGTPQIYGGVIVAGPAGSKFEVKGTADIRFSREALNKARYIGKLQAYRVLSWYE